MPVQTGIPDCPHPTVPRVQGKAIPASAGITVLFINNKRGNIMRHSKLYTVVTAAILLGGASLVSAADGNNDGAVQRTGGVSYVSGGVGLDSIDHLSSLARDFNLKLVFALKSGDYVSDVKVTIANASGRTMLDTTSEGPWLLTKLPAGNYQIVATLAGKSEKRAIAVGAEKLKTVDFRWSSE